MYKRFSLHTATCVIVQYYCKGLLMFQLIGYSVVCIMQSQPSRTYCRLARLSIVLLQSRTAVTLVCQTDQTDYRTA
jgi:hypothetical protein